MGVYFVGRVNNMLLSKAMELFLLSHCLRGVCVRSLFGSVVLSGLQVCNHHAENSKGEGEMVALL